MKIFLIIDEFPFFLPEYVDEVIQKIQSKHTVVGITPLITPKGKPTFSSYLIQQLPKLGYKTSLLLFLEAVKIKFSPGVHTIAQVAKKYHIHIYKTKNINDPEFLVLLEDLHPDIIISSCSQIFKKRLLKIPKIACINRHSGLLPSYGGLFPVFQAMLHGEKYTGVTVHTMVEAIDKGKILSQIKIPIQKHNTLFSLYQKSYKVSTQATIDAIHQLEKKKPIYQKPIYKPSYFSFPTPEDWNIFWRKNKRVI